MREIQAQFHSCVHIFTTEIKTKQNVLLLFVYPLWRVLKDSFLRFEARITRISDHFCRIFSHINKE